MMNTIKAGLTRRQLLAPASDTAPPLNKYPAPGNLKITDMRALAVAANRLYFDEEGNWCNCETY